MSRRTVPLLPLAVLAASLCGCGTCCNTVWFTPEEGGKRPYGGVQADVKVASQRYEQEGASPAFWRTLALSSLDVPLSAVGDTLTLPYILWWNWNDEAAGPTAPQVPVPSGPR